MHVGRFGVLVMLCALSSSSVAPGQSRSTEFDAFGPFLDGLMVEYGVPGFSFALFDPLASSTLHTTASDLASFGTHLATEILTGGPYASLATPAVPVRTTGDLEHSWGPGLGIVTDGSHRYVYHTGNNVIFIADFIYGVEENLGYVLLTNSANGP